MQFLGTRILGYFILFGWLLCASESFLAAEGETSDPVKLYYELNSDDSYSFFADNTQIIPCYVKLEFTTLQNLTSTTALPMEAVIPAGALRVELLKLLPAKGKSTRFAYSWLQVRGDPINTVPVSDYPYLFPFEHGKKFKIVQGFNGKFTHFGQNQYAIDFNLPEGTPVCAARDGLVIDVKSDSNQSGTAPEFNQYNNYIWVYHSDGTVGNYVHLKQHGALVSIGEQVKAGQLIGYSGNTGLSSGPHLHFDLRIPTRSGEMQSIPFEFLNYDERLVVPVAGQYFYSIHPGLPEFTVNLGRLLNNDDFRGFIQKTANTGKVTLRSEHIDDTYILFLENGNNTTVKAKITLDLKNLGSSVGNPVNLTVPPQTEVFLGILNALDSLDSYSFNASIITSWTK